MRMSKNRYFHHIFVFPGYAPGAITLNVVWVEREFDAYKLSRSMYPSIFNSFPVIRTASAKKSPFLRNPTFYFCLPRGRPGGNHAKRCMNEKTIQCLPNPSQHVAIYIQQFPSYSNRKFKKSPFSRTAAHIFVSPGDAPGAIALNVVWMEREFDAYKLLCSMYPSILTVSK